jgi:hypothetical protein
MRFGRETAASGAEVTASGPALVVSLAEEMGSWDRTVV